MASRNKSGFGKPAPLPGQPGFVRRSAQRESDQLEDETTAMAERLQALRNQMSREKELRESGGSKVGGGTRWRSARTDRSVRNYAKEVKEKYQKRVDEARRGSSSSSSSSTSSSGASSTKENVMAGRSNKNGGANAMMTKAAPSALRISKQVGAWEVADTTAWLMAIGLDQYASVFEANEISGPILLEVGLDDLDYMNIRVLAHRKLLLKGIEDLKQNGRPTLDLRAPANSPTRLRAAADAPMSAAATDSNDVAGVAEPKQSGTGETLKHWSQVKPLSENKTDGSSATDMVNLADGTYDEAAQRAEFQAAVMAWRSGDVSTNFGSSGRPETDTPPVLRLHQNNDGAADDGMWHNPWGGDSKSDKIGTGSLLEGTLDEKVEHEEFARAVAEWRSGGTKASRSNHSEAPSTTSAGTAAGSSSVVSSQDIADELARKMDEGFQDQSSQLAAKRREAEEHLRQQQSKFREQREASRAAEELRKQHEKEISALNAAIESEEKEMGVDEESLELDCSEYVMGFGDYRNVSSRNKETNEAKSSPPNSSKGWKYLDLSDTQADHDERKDAKSDDESAHQRSFSRTDNVEVRVLEVSMGYTPRGGHDPSLRQGVFPEEQGFEEGGYVVVEESDED